MGIINPAACKKGGKSFCKEFFMTVVYPVIFTQTKDEKDTVLAEIPDIDGATEGYGVLDAIAMAKDYIGNALFNKPDSETPAVILSPSIIVSKRDSAEEILTSSDRLGFLFRRPMKYSLSEPVFVLRRYVSPSSSLTTFIMEAADTPSPM